MPFSIQLPPLQVIGLMVDILGTFVIILPDIPILNSRMKSGQLRDGRVYLEAGLLTRGLSSYQYIIDEIETFETESISPKPDLLDVRYETLGVGGGRGSVRRIYGNYLQEGEEEVESKIVSDIPYRAFEIHLREEIKKYESRIRAIGFFVLALGFTIQIIGLT